MVKCVCVVAEKKEEPGRRFRHKTITESGCHVAFMCHHMLSCRFNVRILYLFTYSIYIAHTVNERRYCSTAS